MRGRRCGRLVLPLLGLLVFGLFAAPAAQATFHLIKVREVHPGSEDDSYVELQMFAAGQTFLTGHSLTVYGPTGSLVHTSTFSSGIAKGENQRTVLIGDSGVAAKFGVTPDLVDSSLSIPASGGAVCWNAGGIPADCAAWGNFSGGAALQTATGTSAGSPASPGGITAGKAIRRTIEPGCPTLLEESDDTDNSAADFSEVTPDPRNNAATPAEHTCAGAPQTAIDDRPAPNSSSTSAEFTYEAPTATSYECKLDAAAFAACPADGIEYSGLAQGSHTFQVRGVNASGPDPTPASYTWTVDTVAPTTTIDTHPVDPAPGRSSSFGFHASETGAKFECSLEPQGTAVSFSACASPKTYSSLADADYVFAVRATDLAGNVEAEPTSFSWQVDNSLADTTPPETAIDSKPSDPSDSATASFAYSSNEPGSSFECTLDGAAFASCPAGGVSYDGLGDGPHSFQVRAIDPEGNVDPTPAGYSFSVALPVAPVPPPAPPAPPTPGPAPIAAAAIPQTLPTGKAPKQTHDTTPTFRFHSDLAGATYQCSIDGKAFKACRSPLTLKGLKPGRHTLAVRAVLGASSDATPLKLAFTIVRGG